MPIHWETPQGTLYHADARNIPLPDQSVHCVVTSPPYFGLRDYALGDEGIGVEASVAEWLGNIVAFGREVRRVLRDDGTFWVNIGDAYTAHKGNKIVPRLPSEINTATGQFASGRANMQNHVSMDGLPAKSLMGMPWRLAFALQDDGWVLRADIIFAKPNPMPESVKDRPTKAHEYIFLFTKQPRGYYYDADAIREPVNPNTLRDKRVDSTGLAVNMPATEGSPYAAQHAAHIDKFRNSARYQNQDALQSNGTLPRKSRSVPKGWGSNAAYEGQYLHDKVRDNPTYPKGHKSPDPGVGANARSVWQIPTQGYRGTHFATFPEELARRCILAGTSEHGVCAECGAPWARLKTTPEGGSTGQSWHDHTEDAKRGNAKVESSQGYIPAVTIGWAPSCTCNAAIVPAVVLDPFMGSGTTAAVAQQLGRRWAGVDLNTEYLDLAKRRISRVAIPLTPQHAGGVH